MKSSTSASTDNRSASYRLREGNRQVQKQISFPKLASGSSSQNSDTIAENSVTCESGWRLSNRATGTPINKLIAEEMLRETEPRKRSPGVIARLMGFDGLPPHHLSRKQPKMSAENYQLMVTSAERSQRSSTSCGRGSSKRISKEEQEFKDVFEVSDSSKTESSCYLVKGPAKSKLTKAGMTHVKLKLHDERRPSTDEKLHDSEEFHDAIENFHSNQDLLLKYLEEPDPLFTKHLHDLQADPLPSHCNHISGMELLSAQEDEGNELGGKYDKEILWKHRKKHNNSLSNSNNKQSAENVHFKSSKIQVEGKFGSSVQPFRIVVLKPNSVKVLKATRYISSPQSSHDFLLNCKEHTELSSIKDWKVESCAKKSFSNDAAIPRHKSRESKEIAKEITRHMRNNLERGHTKASGFKGYSGDESSSYRYDNESANESEVPSLVSRNSVHRSNRHRPPPSCSAESPLSKEARKRLSERWKVTHRSVDMGVVGRSSTLGEMLALPDSEGRPANADAMVSEKGQTDKFVGMSRPIGCDEPLGISSSDGWKDGCIGNLSRSRSVPASYTTFGSSRTDMPGETLRDDKHLLPKEVTQQERIKLVKENFNHKGASSSRNSKNRTKKSNFSVYSYTDYSDTSPEIQFRRKKVQVSAIEADRVEEAVVIDSRLVAQDVVDVETENEAMPSRPNTDVESLANTKATDKSSTVSQETSLAPPEKGSVSKHSLAVLEPPRSCKEAEQPSPVSVLETSFPDDRSSSSECFENLSSVLHGLWMQIQQLKSGSESYKEGGIVNSSDEVNEIHREEKAEETKEFNYVRDVLEQSGLNFVDQDSFMSSFHTSEHPVNPLVFEELENHWGSESWLRLERKQLFDSMNSSLAEIKKQFEDAKPWVKVGNGSGNRWINNGVDENVRKLLDIIQKNVNKDVAVATDSRWVDVRGEIDGVGREIEELIMEELVYEMIVRV